MDKFLDGRRDTLRSELQRQLIGRTAGDFPLRKWSANDLAVLTDLPVDHRMQRELRDWRPHESHSTFGLQWHSSDDSFSFATSSISIATVTKRSVPSLTARLFDPLGWLAPAIVSAKFAF